MHVNLSTNPSVGYVEFWVNGVQQTFNNGQTPLVLHTWTTRTANAQDSYNKLKWGVLSLRRDGRDRLGRRLHEQRQSGFQLCRC